MKHSRHLDLCRVILLVLPNSSLVSFNLLYKPPGYYWAKLVSEVFFCPFLLLAGTNPRPVLWRQGDISALSTAFPLPPELAVFASFVMAVLVFD